MKRFFSILLLLLALSPSALARRQAITYTSRGVSVPAIVTMPDGASACPVVVMVHGHGGNKDERRGFSAIADALAEDGIGSIRMDLPGCGESSEPFTASCLSANKADVRAAVRYARDVLGAPSIGLFGYSMGGRAVLELLAEGDHPDACALLAPAADTQDLIQTAFEDFAALHEEAKVRGSARQYFSSGNYDELGLAFFDDLLLYDDPALAAGLAYEGPSLVVWADDDQVVRPHVSRHTAQMLRAQTYDASGKGHIYGFWLESDPLREGICEALVSFFQRHLDANPH